MERAPARDRSKPSFFFRKSLSTEKSHQWDLTQAHMAGMRIKAATLGQDCGVRFDEHTTAVARECDGKADCGSFDEAKLLGSRLMRLDGCLPACVAQYVCASEDFVRYTTLHADAKRGTACAEVGMWLRI